MTLKSRTDIIPTATSSHLGRKPGVYTRYDASEKCRVHRQIFAKFKLGLPFESACWACQVDPEEVTAQMSKNRHVYNGFKHQLALREEAVIKTMQEGGRGLSEAKAAQLILETQHKAWAKASASTLEKKLEHALEVLKKKLEPETFEIVVRTLERFA